MLLTVSAAASSAHEISSSCIFNSSLSRDSARAKAVTVPLRDAARPQRRPHQRRAERRGRLHDLAQALRPPLHPAQCTTQAGSAEGHQRGEHDGGRASRRRQRPLAENERLNFFTFSPCVTCIGKTEVRDRREDKQSGVGKENCQHSEEVSWICLSY